MVKAMPTFNPGFDSSSIAQALGRLLGYLRSWQNKDGLFGGMIATWWSSTLETAVPHPMNQFPIIQGFLELHRGSVGGVDWLKEACRVGDGLIESIGQDGLFKNAWGDIPGKATGPILHIPGITALAELFTATGQSKYLTTAMGLLKTVRKKWAWGVHLHHRVANQQCKWAEAHLALFEITRDQDMLDRAKRIISEVLEHQIISGTKAGGIYQGRLDDRLITVYCAKCLGPLVRLYEITGQESVINGAIRLGRFLQRMESPEGIWSNCAVPVGKQYKRHCRWAGLDRRMRYIFPVHRWRRDKIKDWVVSAYPSFIARAGDGIASLQRLGKFDSSFKGYSFKLLNKMLSLQMAHGGIPNTVGYQGKPDEAHLQDVICPTRWNAYAFYALCRSVVEQGVESVVEQYNAAAIDLSVGENGIYRFRENNETVEMHKDSDLIFRIIKPTGESLYVDENWRGDLTGPRLTL